MKKLIFITIILFAFTGYTQEKTDFKKIEAEKSQIKKDQAEFKKTALNEVFLSVNNEEITFQNILENNKGKTIFIDIWASWCSDCIGSIPELKELQANEKDVVFVMLSLDKTKKDWKNAIKKYLLPGEHYFFTKKWKESGFCSSIKLDWIPRYMIVGKDGSIKMYKSIKFTDKIISETIKLDE